MSSENTAVKVSSGVALLLLSTKIIIGILTGSIAVLSSAIDSLLDLFVSLFNLIAIKNSQKPADENFNYGRGKMEGLASFLEGFIITISGLFIMYESVMKIISGEKIGFIWPAIYVMIFSVIMTFWLVTYLQRVYKKTGNIVIEADSFHYRTDLYTNAGILLSLVVIKYTGFYIIDGIVGIIIAVYIIFSAFHILKKWFLLILDIALPKDKVEKIREIITSQASITDYHFLRTRQAAKINFVQGHLVFKDPNITLIQAHDVSDIIECAIAKIDTEKEWLIDFHLDPFDDKDIDKNEKCKLL
jgi:ferrous-iron efflux pump FieF